MKNKNLKIAVSSGKGGTGKTFVATNMAHVLNEEYKNVSYFDCDVEEPNGHLFLKPEDRNSEAVKIISPMGADPEKCNLCGRCEEACSYNAIVVAGEKVMLFQELCHVCGACSVVCPKDAIIEEEREIGILRSGRGKGIECVDAILKTGEGGMSPRLISRVKAKMGRGINILDSPPGTSCTAVETLRDVDVSVLVTDPTPFGINDLKLSVDMVREIGQEPVIVVNRADYRDNKLKEYCREENLNIVGEIPDERKIAEGYSRGELAVENDPAIEELFKQISENILESKNLQIDTEKRYKKTGFKGVDVEKAKAYSPEEEKTVSLKEFVVISGKGGTGKTSLTACFADLSNREKIICDCDVDAADLHLVLDPKIREKGYFSGGFDVNIDPEKCTGCGACYQKCRFSAIDKKEENGQLKYEIDPVACEGCGVCDIVCDFDAIDIKDAVNGRWYISDTPYGPFTHAKLGIAEENSGRLVTLVKDKAKLVAGKNSIRESLIDGAPGTGCPVISSLNGARYAVIVTEPTVSGIHDLNRIIDVAEHFKIDTGIIVNKYDLNEDNTRKIKKLGRERNIDLLGQISYDTIITEAQMKGVPLTEYAPDSEISKNIKSIHRKINRKLNK
ncbi:MAG: P-loop NTPase [Elusimicrobiota bacterium]